MPTIITHAVVPLALGLSVRFFVGRNAMPTRVLIVGALFAMLPDLDVLGFKLGIAYNASWGHRGATHSLAFAAMCSLTMLWPWLRARAHWLGATAFAFISMASHGLLDTLTNGGLGAALLWPNSDARFFAAVRPIEVSPIGLTRMLTERGLIVIQSELTTVWLPATIIVLLAGLVAALTKKYRVS